MIVPPTGVRVWLANGHTDMRRGMDRLALRVQQALQRDRHAGDLYVFRGRRGKHANSAYSLRRSTIAYRWDPLSGQTLQVSPHRHGKDLTCIYTAERPELCRPPSHG